MSIENELAVMKICIKALLSLTPDERVRTVWYLNEKIKHFNQTTAEKITARKERIVSLNEEISKCEKEIRELEEAK